MVGVCNCHWQPLSFTLPPSPQRLAHSTPLLHASVFILAQAPSPISSTSPFPIAKAHLAGDSWVPLPNPSSPSEPGCHTWESPVTLPRPSDVRWAVRRAERRRRVEYTLVIARLWPRFWEGIDSRLDPPPNRRRFGVAVLGSSSWATRIAFVDRIQTFIEEQDEVVEVKGSQEAGSLFGLSVHTRTPVFHTTVPGTCNALVSRSSTTRRRSHLKLTSIAVTHTQFAKDPIAEINGILLTTIPRKKTQKRHKIQSDPFLGLEEVASKYREEAS
ncbi:hypothetical protein DFH06DRAFT_1124623 [Mycena polygramma]|nr:hypothetical protein DFH06DRAFT_1124623 [Mycena polygramma]